MRVLFISRKKSSDTGGLSRFVNNLTSYFPNHYLLSPNSLNVILKLPFARFDLIHICDATLLPLGIILKLFFRKPLTLTAHGLDITYRNILYQTMLNILLPLADTVILDSQSAKKLLNSFQIPREKITVIPPGISIDQFSSPSQFNLPNLKNKVVLLTVGNLVLRKGHTWLITNVLLKLPKEFIYLIVGDGPEKRNIQNLINKFPLKSRVYLFGNLSDHELAYVFSKAHIYVCPNQHIEGDFEAFGIACGEAANLGLPVVASKVDGISEVIKDRKNGFLVEPNSHSYIEILTKLKNSKKKESIGLRASTYTSRKFDWKKTGQQYLKIFREVIRQNSQTK